MPATPSRIGFVLQEFRSVEATDAAVKTKYGDLARDTLDEPIETFFDSIVDAQAMADERLALLKADRRRFRMDARGAMFVDAGLDFSQVTPTAAVIDDERQADHSAAIVEIGVDFGADQTAFVTWG